MRTSATQFDMIVRFMEKYGDLSLKPQGLQGKIWNDLRWRELRDQLNADPTGDSKATPKWRKVWSDLKNNTRKKADRINKGGGNAMLTSLEERVINIKGTKTAPVVQVVELGISEDDVAIANQSAENNKVLSLHSEEFIEDVAIADESSKPITNNVLKQDSPEYIEHVTIVDNNIEIKKVLRPNRHEFVEDVAKANKNTVTNKVLTTNSGLWDQPYCVFVSDSNVQPIQTSETNTDVFSSHTEQESDPFEERPKPMDHSSRRRRHNSNVTSPHRRKVRTQMQSEMARRAFLRSDEEWRQFRREMARENLRLRQVELRQQDRWLNVFQGFLNLGNRIADIYARK